ncbi:O-methyltransferase [Niallia sp. NCCP-28]|uniref:O-methyltransferase n=1 Tax=Niallia sp. NCCP-28 TaxID=2934712 RepID=UPI002089E4CF|nr:O-methyltransferase [Niallia sp. NCCP-28]GKU81372.1 putative O-methyltransferase YrrM [Niallia sp. NCCP-28]
MQEDKITAYIEALVPQRTKEIEEIENYAHDNDVPIMELVGIESLLQLLRIQKPKTILEIGTAIGYSAIRMANALPNATIVTVERDEQRYKIAEQNVDKLNKQKQIKLIYGDAFEVESLVQQYGPYDVLFIDAAKSQYRKFFDIYSKQLSDEGIIFTDNVLFHGLVAQSNIESRNVRALVRKINNYNEWLMSHPEYETVILPVGDGIAISKKRR